MSDFIQKKTGYRSLADNPFVAISFNPLVKHRYEEEFLQNEESCTCQVADEGIKADVL